MTDIVGVRLVLVPLPEYDDSCYGDGGKYDPRGSAKTGAKAPPVLLELKCDAVGFDLVAAHVVLHAFAA